MKKRILLVDDEPMVLRIMRVALAKEGHQIDLAADGVQALAQIEAACPDLMVTDIDMPNMTGKELCLHLQENMPDRKFPIFISTSLAALHHRDWSKAIGNLHFLEKPISIRQLTRLIDQHTGANSPSEDLAP